MKMIDRPSSMPETETRLDACFDITDGHFDRVWYVCGPVGRLGEGDAGGNCCYDGVSAQFYNQDGKLSRCLNTRRGLPRREGGSTRVMVKSRGARLIESG